MTDKNSFRAYFNLRRSSRPEQPEKLKEMEEELLENLAQCESAFVDALRKVGAYYINTGRRKEAVQITERLAFLSKDPSEKASYYLNLGAQMEGIQDYESAITFYSRARSLEPTNPFLWYFINNNLGYCLNQFGRFDEAEPCCRLAIKVDPSRHNAYKNLGVSLEGQGQWAEAAKCYLQAVRANVADPRALRHLQSLVENHPEISQEIPDIDDRIHEASEETRKIMDGLRNAGNNELT
jgi:tetratricopeptide (TPR) repeat protein